MVKAIFFDIDGTILSHTISDIPQNTLKTLDRLREKGILLFVATGRHLSEMRRLPLHDYPFDAYVTQTGQLCYDQNFKAIYKEPLSKEDTEVLVRHFNEKKIPLVLLNEEELYMNYVDETVISTQISINTAVPQIGTYKGEELYGATVFGKGAILEQLMNELKECKESSWHKNASDIILKSSGKVKGIEEILKHFDLKREETMAFGDADNDLEMLDYAAIGVAMGNGTDRLKSIADYVTASVDDDGITKALIHYGIIDEEEG